MKFKRFLLIFLLVLFPAAVCWAMTYRLILTEHHSTVDEANAACQAFPGYHHSEWVIKGAYLPFSNGPMTTDHAACLAYSGGPDSWDCGLFYLDPDYTPPDSDGDGIPDNQDPCPNNADCDGDGVPDGRDPCPQNPNPSCTDPENPPGPDIPDSVDIGACKVDIKALKAWLLSDTSFPFNFLWRISSLLSPLFQLSPAPPVFDLELPLDPSSKYSWVPDKFTFHLDFTPYDYLATMLRYFEIVSLCIAFAFHGMKRYRNFTGTGA